MDFSSHLPSPLGAFVQCTTCTTVPVDPGNMFLETRSLPLSLEDTLPVCFGLCDRFYSPPPIAATISPISHDLTMTVLSSRGGVYVPSP